MKGAQPFEGPVPIGLVIITILVSHIWSIVMFRYPLTKLSISLAANSSSSCPGGCLNTRLIGLGCLGRQRKLVGFVFTVLSLLALCHSVFDLGVTLVCLRLGDSLLGTSKPWTSSGVACRGSGLGAVNLQLGRTSTFFGRPVDPDKMRAHDWMPEPTKTG